MKLSDLKKGQEAVVVKVDGDGAFRSRIMEMGFVKGRKVTALLEAPLQDPVKYSVLGYELSLRRSEADMIEVSLECEAAPVAKHHACGDCCSCCSLNKEPFPVIPDGNGRKLKVALVGNPNCGKTSLFNVVSGAKEHVGNYSGVTVESKTGVYKRRGYEIEVVDLPGTYSLASFSPEEKYVRDFLIKGEYDAIINVVDSSNLERNLFLTTELIDMHPKMVIALNMYDELQRSGAHVDYELLGGMIGVPMVPLIAKKGEGVGRLFDTAIAVALGLDHNVREITVVKDPADKTEQEVSAERYGFIEGALAETYTPGDKRVWNNTRIIDAIVTNKLFGFPLFLAIMFVVFWATFSLGQYPMDWIEAGVEWLGQMVARWMPEGWLKDMVADGIIGGVGGVIVFLPNILILYFCISFMEDSGYMARAAFIMDKIMHKIGVHGKSFIPLVMGFGCNVPAIMAARTIESRSSRIITILINPFMICSARLPVIVLLVGTFFPYHSTLVFMGLYLAGIIVAALTARLLRRFVYKKDETPFVMELPPYRIPTMRASLRHTWAKGEQYLRKMGGLILVASLVIWVLNYFPLGNSEDPQRDSWLEAAGKFVNPVMEPIGFQWPASVAALAGVPAKEVVVSTLGVLCAGDEEIDELSLGAQLRAVNPNTGVAVFTAASALSFLVFVLLYCPCVATITAVAREAGGWRYAAFSIIYNTVVAWIIAFIVYRIMLL